MTDFEIQFKQAMEPIVADLMNRLNELKTARTPAPAPEPDKAAIAAAEKVKTVNEIKAWSERAHKNPQY